MGMASQINVDIRTKKKKLKQQFMNVTYGNRQYDKLISNLNDVITDYYSVSYFYFLRGKVWLERLSNYLKQAKGKSERIVQHETKHFCEKALRDFNVTVRMMAHERETYLRMQLGKNQTNPKNM